MSRGGDTLRERVANLDGQYSDLTIKYGNNGERTFHGHRNIICPPSGYFRNILNGAFKEASTGEIDLSASKGYDPDALESVFDYMYTDDYPRKSRQQTSAPPPIVDPLAFQAQEIRNQTAPVPLHLNDGVHIPKRTISTLMPGVVGVGSSSRGTSQKEPVSDQGHVDPLLHVKVYILADMFQIPKLKEVAQQKLQDHLSHETDAERFAELCLQIYDPDYTMHSDRGLRDLIVQMYREQNELFTSQPVQEIRELAPELFDELSRVDQGLPPACDDS